MQAIQEITKANPSIAGSIEIPQTRAVIQLDNIHKTGPRLMSDKLQFVAYLVFTRVGWDEGSTN